MESENTKMSEVFGEFLASIDDYSLTLGDRDERDLGDELLGYYRSARRRFTKSKKDLGTSHSSFYDLEGDEEDIYINSKLEYQEIDIIVSLMLVSYLRPVINSNKVLRQALTDKDFNLTSQANHLNQLTIWYRRLSAEADRAMTRYTYSGLGD